MRATANFQRITCYRQIDWGLKEHPLRNTQVNTLGDDQLKSAYYPPGPVGLELSKLTCGWTK